MRNFDADLFAVVCTVRSRAGGPSLGRPRSRFGLICAAVFTGRRKCEVSRLRADPLIARVDRPTPPFRDRGVGSAPVYSQSPGRNRRGRTSGQPGPGGRGGRPDRLLSRELEWYAIDAAAEADKDAREVSSLFWICGPGIRGRRSSGQEHRAVSAQQIDLHQVAR